MIHPISYVGSPLSGHVDLEGRCVYGWKGFEGVTGWRIRAAALRETISKDHARWMKFQLFKRGTTFSVVELLESFTFAYRRVVEPK